MLYSEQMAAVFDYGGDSCGRGETVLQTLADGQETIVIDTSRMQIIRIAVFRRRAAWSAISMNSAVSTVLNRSLWNAPMISETVDAEADLHFKKAVDCLLRIQVVIHGVFLPLSPVSSYPILYYKRAQNARIPPGRSSSLGWVFRPLISLSMTKPGVPI